MKTIIEQINAWAETNNVAFEEENASYTYKDLKRDSDAVASSLANMNLPAGPVAVFGPSDYFMLATMVGVAKSGHAYIPVDAHTPLERLELILGASKPVQIISTVEWPLENVEATPAVELFSNRVEDFDATVSVSGNDDFYMIYTSGTTGVPKGVQISHDNLQSFLSWMEDDLHFSENERVLIQAPFSFDLSVMSLYPALTQGLTLVSIDQSTVANFALLFKRLPGLHVNAWISTPSFVDICLMSKDFTSSMIPEMKNFYFCGEELLARTAQNLLDRFEEAKVFNTDGPTEATVAVTAVEITPEIIANHPRLPIGKPQKDIRLMIVDEDFNEVPQGENGELILVGKSVAKGYYQNPEKTEEAFLTVEGEPAYRTKDACAIEEDGNLYYHGRIDFQVKVNGFRIELQDIEAHLVESPYVKQAVVLPEYQDFKVKRLVATIVPNENEFEKEYELTKAIFGDLRERVMDYMVPQRAVYMNEFPINQNGKTDRKAIEAEVFKK
jgi:D-alanine--poly(phosphoribitol) ligase subunit 1